MNRTRTFCCTMLLMLLASSPQLATAATKVIETTHTYLMGDRDSRQDAVRMCYAEAKRKAAEQAGTYMESVTTTQNFALESDEVRSFTAALIRAEELEDMITMEGQRLSVFCRSRVTVDPDVVAENLQRIANDPTLRNELLNQNQAIEQAQDDVLRPPPPPPPPNGKPRNDDPYAIDDRPLDDKRMRALNDVESLKRKRDRFLKENRVRSDAAKVTIRKGMSPRQVVQALGKPQRVKRNKRAGYTYACAQYGKLTVVFKDDRAMCLRKRLEKKPRIGVCHCAGSTGSFVWR